MSFFEYIPENTIYHRLHPLVKLIYVLVMIVSSWFNVWSALIIMGISLASFYVSKSWKQRGVGKTLTITTIILFLLNWFLYSVAYPSEIWLIDRFLSLEGLYLSSLLTFRILIIIINIMIFFSTTTPEELEDFLLSIHLPSSLIISFTLTITFIPLVANEIKRIYQAQLLRGITRIGLVKRITGYISSMMLPLMISILNRANRVAEVLEIYGVPPENRTILTNLRFQKRDYIGLIISLLLVITFYLLGLVLPPQLISLSPYV